MALNDELLSKLNKKAADYESAGRKEEIVYWIGSALAAIFSAIAGLSIAANISDWRPPYGKIIAACLAIVPAVWTAAERSLHLRRLSIFNYTVASQLEALGIEVRYGGHLDPKTAATRFAEIVRQENELFSAVITAAEGEETPVRPHRSDAARPEMAQGPKP
jgi:hypothetical protein